MTACTSSEYVCYPLSPFERLLTLLEGVLYYDHLLTLDTEIDYIWKGLGAAYWFYIIRYAGFAGNIPVTVFSFYALAPKVSTIHY